MNIICIKYRRETVSCIVSVLSDVCACIVGLNEYTTPHALCIDKCTHIEVGIWVHVYFLSNLCTSTLKLKVYFKNISVKRIRDLFTL